MKTGKHYKHSTGKTKRCIEARWNEGFTENEFRKVIDNMTSQWLNDEKMNQYLRPETLFGTKFEGYLNQELQPSGMDQLERMKYDPAIGIRSDEMQSMESLARNIKPSQNIVEEQRNLKCNKCGNTYDYYKFSNGHEFRHGCDCTMIQAGKEAEKNVSKNILTISLINPLLTIHYKEQRLTVTNHKTNNKHTLKIRL